MRRLVAPLREFGLAAGSVYLLDRLLQALSPRLGVFLYELMMQPVRHEPLLPARLSQNLRFVEIGPGDPDLARMPVRDEIKVSRFAQGSRCLGIYRTGLFIGYVWFCFGAYHEDEVRCTYELKNVEPAAWDFDLYVFPEHRMGIGFSAIWHGAFEYLRDRGIERSLSRVTLFNLASRRAHARLGSIRIGRVFFVKLWQLEVAVGSVAPYIAATWTPRQRVRLAMPGRALTAECRVVDRKSNPSGTPTGPAL